MYRDYTGMEWRIREDRHNAFAECGMPNSNPFIMSDFIVYESHRFHNRKEAEKYIKQITRRK